MPKNAQVEPQSYLHLPAFSWNRRIFTGTYLLHHLDYLYHFQFLPEIRLFPLQHHLQSDIFSEKFSQLLKILSQNVCIYVDKS